MIHPLFLKTFKNINREIIGHLNINAIEGKFAALKEIMQCNIDILVISETKLDESYSAKLFDIEGYTLPFRLGRNINGGGVLVYVKEGIPCRELKPKHPTGNLRKNNGYFLRDTITSKLISVRSCIVLA